MVWRSDGPQGSEAQKIALDIVHLMHGRVLDLGCGPRKVLPGKNILGIDSNVDERLFGYRANPDIHASCEKLDMFADGAIDVVFSSHLIEHIEDYQAALREWWRVLRPGGRLILYAPHAQHYPNRGMPGANPDHKHDFLPEDMTEAMRTVAWRTGKGWVQERDETRTGGAEYSFLQIYRKTDSPTTELFTPPPPQKSLGLVRLGAFGDALWISTVLPALKAQGYRIVLYTQPQGEQSLRHDPHIDEFRTQPAGIFGESGEAAHWQGMYWLHCEKLHDRFINLVGCVERHLLPHPSDPNFYLPSEQRRRLMGRNYYEAVHEWAGVPFDAKTLRVRFYAHPDEIAWAAAERARHDGPFVVINPGGSSAPKWWPHTQKCMELLAEAGVGGVVVGDLRNIAFTPPPGWQVIGTAWDIRKCYALAALADVVIGTESAIVNSVAHEPPLKIVLLSHSTPHNLTRDWDRTIAVTPEGLDCYPCHRIHPDFSQCSRDVATGSAACQSAARAETVAAWALDWIRGAFKEAA